MAPPKDPAESEALLPPPSEAFDDASDLEGAASDCSADDADLSFTLLGPSTAAAPPKRKRRRTICTVSLGVFLVVAAVCAASAVSLTQFERNAAKGTTVRSAYINVSTDGNVYAHVSVALPHSSSLHNVHVGAVHCAASYEGVTFGDVHVPELGDLGFRAPSHGIEHSSGRSIVTTLSGVDFDVLSHLESDWSVHGTEYALPKLGVTCTVHVQPTIFRIIPLHARDEHVQPSMSGFVRKAQTMMSPPCTSQTGGHSAPQAASVLTVSGVPGHQPFVNISLGHVQHVLRQHGMTGLRVMFPPSRFAVWAPAVAAFTKLRFADGPAAIATDSAVLALGTEADATIDVLGLGGRIDLVWRSGRLPTTSLVMGSLDQLAVKSPDSALSHFAGSTAVTNMGNLAVHAEGAATMVSWWISGYNTKLFQHANAPPDVRPRTSISASRVQNVRAASSGLGAPLPPCPYPSSSSSSSSTPGFSPTPSSSPFAPGPPSSSSSSSSLTSMPPLSTASRSCTMRPTPSPFPPSPPPSPPSPPPPSHPYNFHIYVDVYDRQAARRLTLDVRNLITEDGNAGSQGTTSLSAASISEALFVANATWSYNAPSQDVTAQLTANWGKATCSHRGKAPKVIALPSQLSLPPLRLSAAIAGRYRHDFKNTLLTFAGGATLYPASSAPVAVPFNFVPSASDLSSPDVQHVSLEVAYKSILDSLQLTATVSSSAADFIVQLAGAGEYTIGDKTTTVQVGNVSATYKRPSTNETWTVFGVQRVNAWSGWVRPNPTRLTNITIAGVSVYGVDGLSRGNVTIVNTPTHPHHPEDMLQVGIMADMPGQSVTGTGQLQYVADKSWSMHFEANGRGPLSQLTGQSSGTIALQGNAQTGPGLTSTVVVGPSTIGMNYQGQNYQLAKLSVARVSLLTRDVQDATAHACNVSIPGFALYDPSAGTPKSFSFVLNRTVSSLWKSTTAYVHGRYITQDIDDYVDNFSVMFANASATYLDVSSNSQWQFYETLNYGVTMLSSELRHATWHFASDVVPLRLVDGYIETSQNQTFPSTAYYGPIVASSRSSNVIHFQRSNGKVYKLSTGPMQTNLTDHLLSGTNYRRVLLLSVPSAELDMPDVGSARLSLSGEHDLPYTIYNWTSDTGVALDAAPVDYLTSWQLNLDVANANADNLLDVQSAGQANLTIAAPAPQLLVFSSPTPTRLSVDGVNILTIEHIDARYEAERSATVLLRSVALGKTTLDVLSGSLDLRTFPSMTLDSHVSLDSGCNANLTGTWVMTSHNNSITSPANNVHKTTGALGVVIRGAQCGFEAAYAGASMAWSGDLDAATFEANDVYAAYTELDELSAPPTVLFEASAISLNTSMVAYITSVNGSAQEVALYGVDGTSTFFVWSDFGLDRAFLRMDGTTSETNTIQMLLGVWTSGPRIWTAAGSLESNYPSLPDVALSTKAYVGPLPRNGFLFQADDVYLNISTAAGGMQQQHALVSDLRRHWQAPASEPRTEVGILATAEAPRVLLGVAHLQLQRTFHEAGRSPFGKYVPEHYNTTFVLESLQSALLFDGTVASHFWTATLEKVTTAVMTITDPSGQRASGLSTFTQLPGNAWRLAATANDFGGDNHLKLDTAGQFTQAADSFSLMLDETSFTTTNVHGTEIVLSFASAQANGTWGHVSSGASAEGQADGGSVMVSPPAAVRSGSSDTTQRCRLGLRLDDAVFFRQPMMSGVLNFTAAYSEGDRHSAAQELFALNVTAIQKTGRELVDLRLALGGETSTERDGAAVPTEPLRETHAATWGAKAAVI